MPNIVKSDVSSRKTTDIKELVGLLSPQIRIIRRAANDSPAESSAGAGENIIRIIAGERTPERRSAGIPTAGAVLGDRRPSSSALSRYYRHIRRGAGTNGIQNAVASPEDILRDLRRDPPAAVFLDIDATLTFRDENGATQPIANEVIEKIDSLLERGIPVVIDTGRSLRLAPPPVVDTPISAWDILIGRIRPDLRRNLIFVGQLGSQIASFDAQGNPDVVFSDGWSEQEQDQNQKIVDSALSEAGLKPEDLASIIGAYPGLLYAVFKPGDSRAVGFAGILKKKIEEAGLDYSVNFNGDQWIYLSKNDKGRGANAAYKILLDRGFPVEENNLLFVGDEFARRPGGFLGSDAHMLLEFPESRAVSVGQEPDLPRAYLLGQGYRASVLAMDAVLEGRRQLDASLWAKIKRPFGRFAVRLAVGAITAAMIVSFLPGGWSHWTKAALGTTLLSGYGLPQILENLKKGKEATDKLSAKSSMGWMYFMLSMFLLTTGFLTGNPWWTASSAFGALKGGILLYQINRYSGDSKTRLQSIAVVAGGLTLPLLGHFNVLVSAAAWASITLAGAIGLLVVLNIPQIRKNYEHYQATRRATSGMTPMNAVLLVLGAIFNFMAALGSAHGPDYRWMVINVVSFITASIMTGQKFEARRTNGLIARLMRLLPSRKPAQIAP